MGRAVLSLMEHCPEAEHGASNSFINSLVFIRQSRAVLHLWPVREIQFENQEQQGKETGEAIQCSYSEAQATWSG